MKIGTSDTVSAKVRKVHDWMVFNLNYDGLWHNVVNKKITAGYTAKQISDAALHKPSDAVWVLQNKLAVANGYTAVFEAFMKELGIECITVSSDTMHHVWNMVKMDDGCWYHVDLTWDDPVNANDSHAEDTWVLGYYRTLCLLRNDAGISTDHNGWTASAPKATGTKYENSVDHSIFYTRSDLD